MSAQTPNLPQNFAIDDNLAQKTRDLLHLVPQHDGRAHCMTVLFRLAEVAWVRIPRPTTSFYVHGIGVMCLLGKARRLV